MMRNYDNLNNTNQLSAHVNTYMYHLSLCELPAAANAAAAAAASEEEAGLVPNPSSVVPVLGLRCTDDASGLPSLSPLSPLCAPSKSLR